MIYRAALFSLIFFAIAAHGQPAKPRKLGPALNVYSFNYQAPFISLDGNTLIFLYDYTEDGEQAAFFSVRQGGNWKEPVAVPKRLVTLAYQRASTLSPDGKTLFLTSQKPGLGGYEIWYATLSGNAFSETMSIGAPINSAMHEGSPTLSADGQTLYFMRCAKMNNTGADDCKIFMAKKDNRNAWATPVELPAIINAGNSQMPRIMADGQTLLFASNKHTPSKGGYDVYMTRFDNGQWTAPVNLDFMNTPADDLFFSASHTGLTVLRDWPGENKKTELVEFNFPSDKKPKTTTRVIGSVSGLADPTKATVRIMDLTTAANMSSTRPDSKGEFITYVPEGSHYGLFVDPPTPNMTYWFKSYDYRSGRVPLTDRITTATKAVGPGDEIVLEGIRFKSNSAELEASAFPILKQAARMIWSNAALQFDLDVTFHGYEEDTIARDDLTETRLDTVIYEMEYPVDSVTTATRDSLAVEILYHNNRAPKQAEAIARYLYTQAVKPERLRLRYKAMEEPITDKKRLVIKFIVH
jgi:outer membrane protein OmpA-like peptidoglycan-associated protein